MAIRGGAWTVKPAGSAVSGSLISIRMTSAPACCELLIDWIVFCDQAGAAAPASNSESDESEAQAGHRFLPHAFHRAFS